MSGRSAIVRGAAAVVVFGVSFAAGSALGEDDRRPAAPHAPAKRAVPAPGALRLDPAAALPELRAVRVKRRPPPAAAPARPSAPAPAAEAETAPAAEAEMAPAEPPPAYTAPEQPVAQAPAAPPAAEQPSSPPPSATETPEPDVPAPDPAPAPPPVPAPDPVPSGGSGQYSGP